MIVPLTLELAMEVTRAMREADRREVYSTRWSDDSDALAQDFATSNGVKYAVLADDGNAVAIFGAVMLTPVVAEVWMVGTDRMQEKEEEMIKAGHVICRSLLNDSGFARLQARTANYRVDTQNLIKLMGFSYEGELKKYGNDGSAFHLYSLTADDNEQKGAEKKLSCLMH